MRKKTKTTSIIALLALFCAAAGPCDMLMPETIDGGTPGDCGAETCVNQLNLEVIRTDTAAFPTGLYRFSFQDSYGTHVWLECYLLQGIEELDCPAGDHDLVFALNDIAMSRIWVGLLAAPDTVSATAEYNGFTIGQRQLVPTYDVLEPNGTSCPPTCYVADEALPVALW